LQQDLTSNFQIISTFLLIQKIRKYFSESKAKVKCQQDVNTSGVITTHS